MGTVADDFAKQLVSPEEARRAYYIDFEGLGSGAPSLLGWVYAEGKKATDDRLVLRHDIFDAALQPAVGGLSIDAFVRHDQQARSLGQSINDLARRAKAQDRLIISWSRHELREVSPAVSPGLLRLFRRSYRDGKATAKRWKSLVHPTIQMPKSTWGGGHTLTRYLDLVGFPLPTDYGLGQTADRIAAVREGLGDVDSFDDLDHDERSAWAGVLHHNAADCLGLRAIVTEAASGLRSAGLV